MTSNRDTGKPTAKDGRGKATSAGPKTRSGSASRQSDASSKPVLAVASEARAHLRAVAPVDVAPDAAAALDAAVAAVAFAAPATPQDPPVKPGKAQTFKRQDLVEAVCARSKVKRAEARVLIDLVLEELGKAFDTHGSLVLPPLGKVGIKRRRPETGTPDILTLKLRRTRSVDGEGDETPLADPGEDG
jgi:hypothetical protein